MAQVTGAIVGAAPTLSEIEQAKRQAYVGGTKSVAAEKDPNNPATTSFAYDKMKPMWDKIDTLLAGTASMRNAGETYLPRHAEESLKQYRERVARSVLFNMSEITLDNWVGQPFGEPLEIPDDMNETIKQILEDDVDLQGNSVDVFARHWFREGLAKSFSHVLVEMPRVTTPVVGQRTLADDRIENIRPYLVKIAPENLIFAQAETINGKETLKQIRILEEITEMVGFAEVCTHQIRILYPGIGEIWKKKKTNGRKEVWYKAEEYTYDLDFIPLVTFYANREGLMCGKSPLNDIVDLNIAHWQSSSDQRSILTVARFPMLALSGSGTATGDDTAQIVVGPNQYLVCPDPASKFYYVEHSGAAIDAGRQDLQDLETQMASYGAEYLKKKPGSQTATARALDSAEATSPLQDAVMRFADALNLAVDYMGQWLKITDLPLIEIDTDFGEVENNQANLTALQAARTNRDISRKAFLDELVREGVLCEEFDAEADALELENELMTGASSLDLLNPTEPTNGQNPKPTPA